jgi:hypothetical protein
MAEPGLHSMVGPRFFGWVIGASHPVGFAADWLTGAWGQNCGNHEAARAAAAVEGVAARWILDILADVTRVVIRRVQADGVCFAGGATWSNRWIMRISVISWPTTEADADHAVEAIIEAWRACRSHVSPCLRFTPYGSLAWI